MMLKSLISLLVIFCIATVSVGQDISHPEGNYKFLENKGQWPEQVNFKANVPGGQIWLESKGILYDFINVDNMHEHFGEKIGDFEPTAERLIMYAEFVGANEVKSTRPANPSTEYYGFFLGNKEENWATGCRAYTEILYPDLYNGIDLLFFEKDGQLKYEYRVGPGSDPKEIKTKYYGESKIKLSKSGNLVIENELGQIIEEKPYVYQVKNGRVVEIESEFVLEDDVVSFKLGAYDASIELVIDPVLIFATYAGSFSDNFGMTATYAYNGEGYSAGMVYGNAYPAPAATWSDVANITVQHTNTTTDAFVSKYSADGSTMLWTNFVGGGDNTQGTETVHSLICDTLNNIYMYGVTSSTDFPTTTNAYQNAHAGGTALQFNSTGTNFGTQGTDIYTVKISADGLNLLGGTYIGGTGNDGVNYLVSSGVYGGAFAYDSLTSNYGDQFRGEIMLDSMNNVYIASHTRSTDFPTVNPIQAANGGQQDGVVFKLSADYQTMLWSTYYGGSENDGCYSVKIDSSYNVIFGGGTSSSDIPGTIGGLTPTFQGGKTDGFIAKLTPDGGTLTQATYIGTNDYDQVFFIEVDRWDNIYCVGQSNGNMPILNAPYSVANSGQFIMKLEPDLATIDYATVFGNGDGDFDISPSAFLVDVCGNVYVSGWGENILQGAVLLNGMPVTTDAFQSTPPNGFDFYLFVMERDAQSLLYGSYLGDANAGEHVDGGTSRFDKFGIVYQSVCGGCGGQTTFPTTTGAHSEDNLNVDPDGPGPLNFNGGGCNNILFKFDFEIVPDADFEISDIEGCAPFTFILDNESNDTINSVWTFPPEAIILQGGINPEIMFNDPGQYEIIISITDTICNLQDTAVKVINVYDPLLLTVSNDTVLCNSSAVDIWANSFGSGTTFDWYDDPGLTNQINAGGLDSAITVNPTQSTTYYVHASNGWPLCDLIDSVTVFLADGAMSVDAADSLCAGDTLQLTAHNLLPSETMTFSWSPTTYIVSQADSTALVNPPSSQWFYVTGTTGSGCVFTDSVYVHVNWINPLTVYATATPDSIAQGGSSVLEAFPNDPSYQYNWFPTSGLSSPTGQTVTVSGIDEDIAYQVTITGGGCEQRTTVSIKVLEFVCGDIYIFVPSAFTPNGDGDNDVLYVRGQNLTEIDLKIFDRWGERVFESTDQAVGWDGTFKGKPMDPDVYVYHLTAICVDGQESLIKGNISLLR